MDLIVKEKDDSVFVNTIIVDNIKRGIASMRELGSNDKEQMHIQEIIAIFTAGTISTDKQKEFTGFIRVSVVYGIQQRKKYELIAENERERLRKVGDSSSSSSASSSSASSSSYVNENEDIGDNEALGSNMNIDHNLDSLWSNDSDGGDSENDEVLYECDIEEDNRVYPRHQKERIVYMMRVSMVIQVNSNAAKNTVNIIG